MSNNKTPHKPLEDSNSSDILQIINTLPPSKREVLFQALVVQKSHTGPLPDSETIRIYNEVIPNGGDRLMCTVEKQLEHRINLENKGLERSFNQSSTGQWMGFGIAIFFGYLSYLLINSGHDWAGGILGTVDIASLVAVFVVGKFKKD